MGWDLGLNRHNKWISKKWISICSHDFGIVPIWTMLFISSSNILFSTRLCFQTGIHVAASLRRWHFASRRNATKCLETKPSASSSLNFGVESFQFCSRIVDLELPIDTTLF